MVCAGVLAGDDDAGRRPRRRRQSPIPCRSRSLRSAPRPTTRGTCWSSPEGCWCRSCAPSAGRGTRPRCWCGPTCRTQPRWGSPARAGVRRSTGTHRPSRSAGSADRRHAAPSDGSAGPVGSTSIRAWRPDRRWSGGRRTPASRRVWWPPRRRPSRRSRRTRRVCGHRAPPATHNPGSRTPCADSAASATLRCGTHPSMPARAAAPPAPP